VTALAAVQPTGTGARRAVVASASRVASVATVTTRDFRVAVVATRLSRGATPTAEVRVAAAHRAEGGTWREIGERRLGETYFWHTVTGPRAVCRLELATTSRPRLRPHVVVQLLLSPSLGCARTYRLPLAP
jgi:hypothetical protein